MPIYEYRCQPCNFAFETLVRPGDDARCPRCDGTRLSREMSVFRAARGRGGEADLAQARMASSGVARSGGCCGGACGCGH